MTRLLRALRPRDGAGSATWQYTCPARCGGHTCTLGRHDGPHRSSIGFSWGQA